MGKRDLNLKVYLEDPRRYADMVNAGIFSGRQMVMADELTSTKQDYSVFQTELKTVFELYSLRESKEELYDYVESDKRVNGGCERRGKT